MFPDNKRFNLARTDIIEVDTIDDVINKQIEFIKIDTQGAELEIIKGAKKKWKIFLALNWNLI
jgi:FkbM family methyltransferase